MVHRRAALVVAAAIGESGCPLGILIVRVLEYVNVLDCVAFDYEVVCLDRRRVQRRQLVEDNLHEAAVVVILAVAGVPGDARAGLYEYRRLGVNRNLCQLFGVVVAVRVVERAVACVVAHDEGHVVPVILSEDYRGLHVEPVVGLVEVLVVPYRGESVATATRDVLAVLQFTRAVERVVLVDVCGLLQNLAVAGDRVRHSGVGLTLAGADQGNHRRVVRIAVGVRKVLRLRQAGIVVRHRERVVHVCVVERHLVLGREVAHLRRLVLDVDAVAQVAELYFYLVFFIHADGRYAAARMHVNRVVTRSRVIGQFDQHHCCHVLVVLRAAPVCLQLQGVVCRVAVDAHDHALVAVAAALVRRFRRDFDAEHRAPVRPLGCDEVHRRRAVGRGQVVRAFGGRFHVSKCRAHLGLCRCRQAVPHLAVRAFVSGVNQIEHACAVQQVPEIFVSTRLRAGKGAHRIAHRRARNRVRLAYVKRADRVLDRRNGYPDTGRG